MNEPNRAVQEDELEAVRSIFGEDWHDIPPKQTAWGIEAEAGWWEVTLRGADERVSVGLRGRMTKMYPVQPPPLSLNNPRNLSPNHVQTLNKLVIDTAKAKVGNAMIFDLADLVVDWISHNHLPLPKPGEKGPTLMEEMAQREEAQRAAEVAQTQTELEQQYALKEEQNRLLTNKIQIDASRKAERANQVTLEEAAKRRQASLATLADGELEMRELVLDTPITVDGYDDSFHSWILFGGRREALWTTYTAEPDSGSIGFVRASLPSLSVQVVDFANSYYSTPHGRKRVDAVAVEATRLRDVKSETVVRVYGVKREKGPKGWERLVILTEKVSEGGKMSRWMPKEGFGEETGREYISQILTGLTEIHRRGATQKQIDLECTWLACPVAEETIAKLSGTGYARRIADMHRSNPFLKSYEDATPDSWRSPDEIDSPYTYSPKRDIWHAGLLLVQMLFGAQTLWRYPNLQILFAHVPGVSENMIDLLNGLLHPNPKKRFNAEEALNRVRAVEDITRRARWSTGPTPIPPNLPSPQTIFGTSPVSGLSYFAPTPQSNAPRVSRYRTDFEEVEFLGKGGFGEVVKARNRLDGRSYAIKKVKLRPEDNEQKVYREVNSLSRVSHHHIVRYYGCWLEDADRPEPPRIEEPSTPTRTTRQSTSREEDIFAANFDDLSVSRQSRSASFPRIRFAHSGEDEDEDEDESDDDTDSSDARTAADPSERQSRPLAPKPIATGSKPSVSFTDTTTDDGMFQRILYIQMEFVEKQTLREAITAGLTEEEVWRLLLQILQALAHMSSLGIVHRDLKPSNILLDASGNVKIADFGLSTTEMTALETAAVTQGQADTSDRTSGIGTSLYIAPEVAISRSYNEKADMYSLGIIFFEMCFEIKTHMERVHILTALRQPSIAFPVAWPAGSQPNQREIVTWLLRHEPTLRPTATQLLTSPLVPAPEKQKEFYEFAIAELTNPKSSQYSALLDALFDANSITYSTSLDNRLDDYTYDNDQDDELQVWLTVVIQRMIDLFQRHGAVETYLPLFIPETALLSAFPDLTPVRLLDQGGKLIQLPSSDILAMARSATRRRIERIKRYHVGHRYADHPAGGQPRVSGELSFDIVSPIQSSVAEAELLEVVDKVISEFQGVRGSAPVDYEFHISHETVLSTMLSSIPDRARSATLKAFKSMGSGMASAQSRSVLSGVTGLPKQFLDDLEQCCVVDDFESVRLKLETLFPTAKRKLGAALDTMRSIINLARACGVSRRVLFRPTLSRHSEFFRGGFMFECVRRGKQRDVIAFGGRYDSLLEHFKEPAQQMQSRRVYGVCMSIAVDQLAKMVRKYESSLSTRLMTKENEDERSFGFWSPARCDVYVASVSHVDLASRLSVIGELWRAGIRADLQYDDDRSIEDVLVECLEQNTPFLVLPRANRPVVKVRSVLKRSEDEIPRNELCTYLRQAIAEQRRIDASYASAEGSIPSAQAAALSVEPRASELDIRLVLPPEPGVSKGTKGRPVRRHRHATKSVYYDKTSEFATSSGSTLPIIGVDLPITLLSKWTLDSTWIHDDEAWRGTLASISTSDRRYADSVREAVQDAMRGKSDNGLAASKGWMWLFSVREARGFLLQTSK